MCAPGPTAAELTAFGLTMEEASEGSQVEIWPDNWHAVNVFLGMVTQWRSDFGVRTGLDYGVLPIVMRMVGVPVGERSAVFEDLRVMEDAALEVLANLRKKK